MRVFDIKNYRIVCELDFQHRTRISALGVNFNDAHGLSADGEGRVCIFNEELQIVRHLDLGTKSAPDFTMRVGFSFSGDLFYV